MKKTNLLVHSLFLLVFAGLTACSTGATDPAEAYKGESGAQIFKAGEDALRDKSYGEAIKRFEALDAQYPYGENNEIAQLHIIYAYYQNSDYLAAEAAADRFIHSHPANPHVDYAYYLRGLANYYQNMGVFERVFTIDFATRDLAQIKKAYNDFAEIDQRFPNSRYAPPAHQYMVYLRNVLANHQLEVAQYYYGREAYDAAVNRASIVILNYEGAPAVPAALVLMAKGYHQLHQPVLENQMIEILRLNFPHSTYLAEALSDEKTPTSVVQAPGQHTVKQAGEKEVMPPVESSAQVTATPVAQQQIQQPSSQVVPQQQALYVPQGNGSRGGQPLALGNLLDSAPTTGFFALHKKPKPVVALAKRPVAASHDDVATTSTTTDDSQQEPRRAPVLASAAPVAVALPPPTADVMYPYKANGAR